MKKLTFISLMAFSCCHIFAQATAVKTVHYAGTQITVPAGYSAQNEYALGNKSFSAQWIYLTKEMVEQGINIQFAEEFEKQLNFTKATNISFISKGEEFTGKKYTLNGESKMKFRILAFGSINGQPLVLNLGFKEDPVSDDKFDELTKKFIQLKK